MARVKKAALKSTAAPDTRSQEHKAPRPVSCVPGAMYGYCPRCSAAVIRRDKPGGDKWGKDLCQMGHTFASMEAMARPLVTPPVNKGKLIKKRGRNK